MSDKSQITSDAKDGHGAAVLIGTALVFGAVVFSAPQSVYGGLHANGGADNSVLAQKKDLMLLAITEGGGSGCGSGSR
jgi:hypothetical protein